MLDRQGNPVPVDADAIRAVAHDLASEGLRVIACARRDGAHVTDELDHHHVTEGFVFLEGCRA